MPGLGNFALTSSTAASSSSSSITLTRCATLKTLDPTPQHESPFPLSSSLVKTEVNSFNCGNGANGARNGRKFVRVRANKGSCDAAKSLEEYVRAWTQKKMESGVDKSRCFLPFLVGAKKLGECLICHRFVSPEEELLCSVRNCQGAYHFKCAKSRFGVSNVKKFKCSQHECYLCKQKFHWRCVRCSIASHDKCAAWPNEVILLKGQPGRTICWRHPTNWRLEKEVQLFGAFFSEVSLLIQKNKGPSPKAPGLADKANYLLNEQHKVPTGDMEEVFGRLPLPYSDEEFNIDSTRMDLKDNKLEPPPYVHIRRNVYLVKKKRDDANFDIGCTSCGSTCCQNCVCRVQSISCSKACRCSENCTNRPFRKEKKIKIVKTEFCGWGVEAAEPINKGDFVIEYIGEVIDDALCEQRLWDMKYKGVQNFYMCEIRKDFTIDASFKGNASRFLNHSCDPNCVLEKWQVEGETRVGVFAARSIELGEPLTYDYRFVQFGPEVKCHCGSLKCQGYLGTKRRVCKLNICWGAKRRRSSVTCLAIVAV